MVELSAPLIASFAVTARCNLNCKYCYYYDKKEADVPAKTLISLVKEFHSMGVFQLMLGGGEPFLHPDIFTILEELLSSDIKISVLSNGTVLDQQHCEKIAALGHKYPGNFFFQISLDSHIPEVNDFTRGETQKAIETIELLVRLGVDVQIACVLTKHNVNVADQLIDHFYPLVKRFHYMGLMPAVKAVENQHDLCPDPSEVEECWRRLATKRDKLPRDLVLSSPCFSKNDFNGEETLKAPGCLAGITRIDIDAELNMVACQIAHFAKMGNLREQSFQDIWTSPHAEHLRSITIPLCWRNFNIGVDEDM